MECQVIEVNGKKYGFLAASRVLPVASWNVESTVPGVFSTYDATALVEAIKEAKTECEKMPHALTLKMMEILDAIRNQWGLVYPGEE